MKNKQELLDAVRTLLEAEPSADIIRMSKHNYNLLTDSSASAHQPIRVFGKEVVMMDDGWPDDYVLVCTR